MAVSLAMFATLAGCRASAPAASPPPHAPPPAAQLAADGSFDWHGLLVAPFGSVLKEIPLALHEVLLFRDEAPGGAAPDDAECYASDAPAPRFVGRVPDEYLLCFKQDRLARIQASVRLTGADAPEVFAAACAGWQKSAATDAGAQSTGGKDAASCEGRDGAIHFSAHLGDEAGPADAPAAQAQPASAPPAETLLSITLDNVANPEAAPQ